MREKAMSLEDITLCGMFTALIAAGAFIKISIPVQPVPMHFTMQFFFVLLAGFLLGGRVGFFSVCSYLAVGLAGVPIFASGGGAAYLARPTFGFLFGFAGAAFVTGILAPRLRRGTFLGLFASALCGLLVMYGCGMVYFYLLSNLVLGIPVTWGIVLVNCFLLTVGGDLFLCVLASVLAMKLLPVLRRIR